MSEEKEKLEVKVSYIAKFDLKYIENMISDGITTGLFGKYVEFNTFTKPKVCIGDTPRNASEKIMKGWEIRATDIDDEYLEGILSLETIKKAIQTMALKYPHLYRDAFLKENYDAISASALLEIAVFDNIVYG